MTDSYKCKMRGKLNRQYKAYDQYHKLLVQKLWRAGLDSHDAHQVAASIIKSPYDSLPRKISKMIVNYSKNPSWFNNMTYTRPRRTLERNKLKQVAIANSDDFDDAQLWPNAKPMDYYW